MNKAKEFHIFDSKKDKKMLTERKNKKQRDENQATKSKMTAGWGIIPKKIKPKKKSNSNKRNEINLNFSSDNLTNY